MPLSRLENFLINTDGNILYVNPSDLDATDSFDNKGNSLTRPFKTLQRALIEAARFAYQIGPDNDRFDKTTILLYPGTHLIDNRPGLAIRDNPGSPGTAQFFDFSESEVTSPAILLNDSTIFDIENPNNVLHKFNSVEGGVIVPKGTSIVGLDLRKTKVKPMYVPDPEDDNIPRSSLFRVTGGCYFWQFSMFDADRAVYFNKNFNNQTNPRFSHHKLTCFEYADGINRRFILGDDSGLTDLQMYYFKLMNAYGQDTGNRQITNFPNQNDFQPNSPEFKIVGDLSANQLQIAEITSVGVEATVLTTVDHGLSKDASIRVVGISSDTYNGTFRVSGISSDRKFTYNMLSDPIDNIQNVDAETQVIVEVDNVDGASPYIFNCSLRSTFGMCGLHADGSKATGFKSMVVAQFTGIGLQKDSNAFLVYNNTTGNYDTEKTAPSTGDDKQKKPLYINQNAIYNPKYENYHVKASNDAVIQAVSVFAIGFSQHFVSEDGADQSITNSNSNFGAKSLIAKGFKKEAFQRDNSGFITHIIPPKDLESKTSDVSWRTLDLVETLAGLTTSRLYLLGETDQDNPPSNITDGYRVGARDGEMIYLDVTTGGVARSFKAPVLMQVPSGDGPSAKKELTVSRSSTNTNIITSNVLRLDTNHNLTTGESVRLFSDNGVLPGGLENNRIYYVITTGNANEIKLADTFNNALTDDEVTIKNVLGGIITVVSRVTDKLPGEIGHPIQYDSVRNNWFITSSNIETTNTIYSGAVGFSTEINANNASTYVQRVPENRDLSDRIYKFRYVVPGSILNAKAPTKNFVLQESSTVVENTTVGSLVANRNPRIIAGITTNASNVATVTTEKSHGLSVNDRVRIKNTKSSLNTSAKNDEGFNGYYFVSEVTGSKTFRYTNANVAGTFVAEPLANPDAANARIPEFERNEYDTTYIIQDIETIQEYNSGTQDGVYYLSCIIGNVSPTATEYSGKKFKQDYKNLYPTIDKDNQVNDPEQSKSSASNKLIGKVNINDPSNSLSKEVLINYISDNRVGFAVTGAIWGSHQACDSSTVGVATIFTKQNHNFNRITSLSVTVAGTGYDAGAGVVTTRRNLQLLDEASNGGEGATVDVETDSSGTITSVSIIDPGAAYGVGHTLAVDGGTSGVVRVDSINTDTNNSIQVVGIGSTTQRNTSDYNGVYRICSVPTAKSVSYALGTNPGIYTDASNGIIYPSTEWRPITDIDGVAGTSLAGIVTVTTTGSHGLFVGNKVKLESIAGTAGTVYSNQDFIIKGVPSNTTFQINSPIGIPTASPGAAARVLKYAIGALGQDTSLQSEKIAGSLINMSSGYRSAVNNAAPAGLTTDSTTLNVASTTRFLAGDFIQIENEVIRITAVPNSTSLTVLRGVMGTRATNHDNGTVIEGIKVVAHEVRRFSSIRASGHTFEYLGYGPGNYSTALPQKIERTLTTEEELLSLSQEQKGGVTFFTGMNDRGDFFTVDGKDRPVERFISEVGNDFTGIFDDLYVRNTLRVGGGPNKNLPSEFQGPVNFTNKITNTDTVDGIQAIKLQLKGNSNAKPFFSVGPEAKPSLVVNQTTQGVGIGTTNPNTDIALDVNGSIRATTYENFKLSDLPTTEEVTFARNRVLKVNTQGTGYELVDVHKLDTFALSSYGISNDGTVYVGIGSTVGNKMQISGISTSNFAVGQKVKVFGISTSTTAIDPWQATTIPSFARVGIETGPRLYRYWCAQYNMRDGRVGIATQIGNKAGLGQTTIDNFNDLEHIALTLNRNTTQEGLLVYRQESALNGAANIDDAQLIAILGPEELGGDTVGIIWKDYGTYDQCEWSPKGNVNQFTDDQIHFPNIATTGQRRGWSLDEIVSIGPSNITLETTTQYGLNSNVGFGTTAAVKLVHDNTFGFVQAIDDTIASGGRYLNIPSGTYLANSIRIPVNFTLEGRGKNTILKHQYFATDETDGGGNALDFDGNFVGIGTTSVGKDDITISDITLDGNNGNNINFEDTPGDSKNYLVYGEFVNTALFKSMEIRNSPAGGLYIPNSSRVSIENCSFVDGSLSDRNFYQPIDASDSSVLRINDSLFENFPGALDVSASEVVSTGGNIIRNCGTGLRTYASGKITTTNNILLGPADEFLPSPDIYDSDYNGINISISTKADFTGPMMQYVEKGEPKDISSGAVSIVAGIGSIIGLYTTETERLGTTFLDFTIGPGDTGSADGFDRDKGYVQLSMPKAKTETLGFGTQFGYEVIGTEFIQQPVGMSTVVGIRTGRFNTLGAGATNYTVTLSEVTHLAASGITTGSVVKLVDHGTTPSLAALELTVAKVTNVGITSVELLLEGLTVNSTINGNETGYITIRNQFVIAQGRVGVI